MLIAGYGQQLLLNNKNNANSQRNYFKIKISVDFYNVYQRNKNWNAKLR